MGAICKAAHARSMFVPIKEENIFKNQFGDKVTNGSMGVDKFKEVDGEQFVFLRFICILWPINSYMRQIEGDSWSPQQCSLLNTLILKEGEYIWHDREDLKLLQPFFHASELVEIFRVL